MDGRLPEAQVTDSQPFTDEWYMAAVAKIEAKRKFRKPTHRNVAAAKEYGRRYYRRNKDRFILRALIREHIKKGLPADLTAADWKQAVDYFGGSCAYCGATGTLEREHIIPVTAGGGLTKTNIVPSCRACNQSKKARLLHDWFKYSTHYSDARLLRLVGWIYGEDGVNQVRQEFGLTI